MKAKRYLGWLAGSVAAVALFTACSGEDSIEEETVASSRAGLGGRFLRDVLEARQKVAAAKERGTVLTPEALVDIMQTPQEAVFEIRDRLLVADTDPTAMAELGDPADMEEAAREYYALFEDLGIELAFDASVIGQQCPGELHEQCAEVMAPDLVTHDEAAEGGYSNQWYACQGASGVWLAACFTGCTVSTGGIGAALCGAGCSVVYNHMSNLCNSGYEPY
jgi:hypothetical protein